MTDREEYFAHSHPDLPDQRWHLLREHLSRVGRLAERFAEGFGGGGAGRLAGAWHDLGKYSGDFQRMIREPHGLTAHIESEGNERDHTSAGAQHALNTLGPRGIPVAFAIACHHTGLKDLPDIRRRLTARGERLLAAVTKNQPRGEVLEATDYDLPRGLDPKADPLGFELFVRMVFSCVVDADFLDTERFYQPGQTAERGGRPTLTDLEPRLCTRLDRLETHALPTAVNVVRRDVRQACRRAAVSPPGVFTLTVPTGGGKTLAAMAFGLAHARRNGLERVVVAIPYTSIIEQNAAVYREVFGDDAVIEHHTSLDPEQETHRNRLACENWDAPIVVTTTVQLFESLFGARTSRCRKLHRLAKAVIILDEAQSIPGRLLPPILTGISELGHRYRTSTVICTATQPAFGRSRTLPEGLTGQREICPPGLDLFGRLERVSVRWPKGIEPTSYEALAKRIAMPASCLAIVHRRRDASELCRLVDRELGDKTTFHLSALMTPAHRRLVLAEIHDCQRSGIPVRAVSTQLVEAGVDLDFPVVFRALAGLDSLAQAAGRCNREGRAASGILDVYLPPTQPPPGILNVAFGVTTSMLRADPALNLFSPAVQREFFSRLYAASDLAHGHELQDARRKLHFGEVARRFALIEDDWSAPLVVAHDAEAAQRIVRLRQEGPSRSILRALQPYTVNVPRRALAGWAASGVVSMIESTVSVLEGPMAGAYHPRFGLLPDRVGEVDAGDLLL